SRAISLHLLSAHSRRLFRNAIMMSGSALSMLTNSDKSYTQRIYLKLAKHVGCDPADDGFTDQVLACLRDVPFEQLVSAQHSSQVLESNFAYFPNVIFGDQFVAEEPLKLISKRDTKQRINLLLGTTEDEGNWILTRINDRYSSEEAIAGLTKAEAMS